MKLKLIKTAVYTLSGKKYRYRHGDMSYGAWLIFKNGNPIYYLNIFDDLYKDIDEAIKKNPVSYLSKKFKEQYPDYSFSQNIYGVKLPQENMIEFDLDRLPVEFFTD